MLRSVSKECGPAMTLLSIKRAAPAQNRRERRARSVSSPSPLIASRVIEDFHMISEHLNVVQEGKNIYPYGAVYVLKRAPFFISLRNEAKDPAIAFCRTNRLNEFLLARGSNEYWGRVGAAEDPGLERSSRRGRSKADSKVTDHAPLHPRDPRASANSRHPY